MTTQVCWSNLNPDASQRGSWDQFIVEELTAGPDFIHREADRFDVMSASFPKPISHGLTPNWDWESGAVVVIPGQHNRFPDYPERLAVFIARLPWSLTIITSDEESLFPVECLPTGPNRALWGQYHARAEFDRVIPIGKPPDTKRTLNGLVDRHRDLDVFFAGQNTHARREELIDVMKDMATEAGHGNISWVASTGFRAGLERDDYLACMARTKIAPCPSGYHSLDSFRLYEGIAAGAVPIIECSTPDAYEPQFWRALYGPRDGSWGTFPIPWVETWEDLPELVKVYRDRETWQHQRDKVQRWYADYRASLAADFSSTIARLQS